MSKVGEAIKHELREAVFPMLFFLIAFHLLAITKTLILDSYEVTTATATLATIGALIVAKVVLIFDRMAFTNIFSSKPLIYGVLWKSVVYSFFVVLFRLLEELIGLWSHGVPFGEAAGKFLSEISWEQFLVVQIWMMVALILFNSIAAIDKHYGEGSMKQLFLKDRLRDHKA